MRPRERRETGEQDLFRSRLDQIIDMDHPLAKLARTVDWRFLEGRFGEVYTDDPGHPPLPTRLMAGLATRRRRQCRPRRRRLQLPPPDPMAQALVVPHTPRPHGNASARSNLKAAFFTGDELLDSLDDLVNLARGGLSGESAKKRVESLSPLSPRFTRSGSRCRAAAGPTPPPFVGGVGEGTTGARAETQAKSTSGAIMTLSLSMTTGTFGDLSIATPRYALAASSHRSA